MLHDIFNCVKHFFKKNKLILLLTAQFMFYYDNCMIQSVRCVICIDILDVMTSLHIYVYFLSAVDHSNIRNSATLIYARFRLRFENYVLLFVLKNMFWKTYVLIFIFTFCYWLNCLFCLFFSIAAHILYTLSIPP